MTSKLSPSIKLVVFDIAGTTVYDGDAVHTCLISALRQMDIRVSRDDVNSVMGIRKPDAIRKLIKGSGSVPPSQIESAVKDVHEFFEAMMSGFYRTDLSVREVTGASDTFRAMKDNDIKVALDSGFPRSIIDTLMDRLGWVSAGLVDVVVGSDEVANGRPHPDMIYRAMDLTGVLNIKEVAKVGDTPADLQEGNNAGCQLVIGVTSGSHTEEQLKSEKYTHLIRSVGDLLPLILEGSFA